VRRIFGADRMTPQTSVIIPVRNGAKFVHAAIASVLAQIGNDDEIIAVDDASTDATPQILGAVGDRRLSIVKAQGRGVSAARNTGLLRTRGEFVAFLDHDDLWPAGRHDVLLQALREDGARGASFGRVRVRFEPGTDGTEEARGLDGRHVCELIGSGLYRRALAVQIGGFCEQMHLREDADFHIRLLEAGLVPLLCEADSLIYRRHQENVTNNREAMNVALAYLLHRKLIRQKLRERENVPAETSPQRR
jgi:glycosyltransferase involved in cell wall biosynthesis